MFFYDGGGGGGCITKIRMHLFIVVTVNRSTESNGKMALRILIDNNIDWNYQPEQQNIA